MSQKKKVFKEAATSKKVQNFMGGTSYEVNPLDELKLIAASSIFGEPSYYRPSGKTIFYTTYKSDQIDILIDPSKFESTVDVFIKAIDNALDYDFFETLKVANELRNIYNIRLNPSIILVRAAVHPKRAEFNKNNPKVLREYGKAIIKRPDDITNQFKYYETLYGGKSKLPSVLKRLWADCLESFSRYQLKKYKSKGIIDMVRISHANSKDIDELMQTGDLKVSDSEKTWEQLRSQGNSWKEIFNKTYIPHMALLRNIRGIFDEVKDKDFRAKVIYQLISGVQKGKQFLFRYYTAWKNVSDPEIKEALEMCMNEAISNFPKLKGKTISLCDNSGSAWGTIPTEYGSVKVAEIANLSAVAAAMASEEGEVGTFGDRLKRLEISKDKGVLTQNDKVNSIGKTVGGGTENGIWLFFDEAINKKIHYDNIFIYSDMQAGHGGLYGQNPREYKEYQYKNSSQHIDVLKLVDIYRKEVNSKVNIFSVQVAGYNNSVIPENIYRGAVLYGWTGKEIVFANALSKIWDSIES
jgi:hypothetical protein